MRSKFSCSRSIGELPDHLPGSDLYDIDYETGSGADTLGLDAQMMGPWLGLTMYFN